MTGEDSGGAAVTQTPRGRQLLDRLFALDAAIRDAAVYRAGDLQIRRREGVADAAAGEVDRHAELLVHPALLTLARQRGSLDGASMHHVLVRYGNCYRWIRPLPDGHVSVGIEPDADVLVLAARVDALVDEWLGRQ